MRAHLRTAKGLQVMGSASLATQLIEHDLVDEYRLMIEPILLGGGKRIFPDDGRARSSWSRSRQPRPASCSAPTGKRATGPAPLARPASAAAPRRSVVNTTEGSNPTPTRHAGLNPGDGTRRRSACGRTPPKFDRVIGALKHNPYEWTLVVPCVLTTTERSFIEGLEAGYQVKISVIDKAELDGRIAMFPTSRHRSRGTNSWISSSTTC